LHVKLREAERMLADTAVKLDEFARLMEGIADDDGS
jgi:hypothetical protein